MALDPQADAKDGAWDLPAVVAISAIFFFVLLSRRLLLDWDEAIYGDIAREFVRGVTHLAPFWNYHPWLERTPLFEWLTAALFSVFGVGNGTARAVSAVSGCATVALCFVWARRLYGRTAAWFAAAILLTTHAFFYQARFGTTDMLLSLWMFLSVYGLYRVSRRDSGGWYAFWVGLALGIMTKSAGPAPVVLTAVVVALKDRWKLDRLGRPFLLGLLVFVAIAAPWHAYMFVHFGRAFYNDYIVRQLLTRSLRPLEGHTGGPFFYLGTILKSAFPWSLLLIPAAVRWVRERHLDVAACYALVIFCFYTLVKTKLPWYITPFYPALALIASREAARFISRPRMVIAALLPVALAGLLYVDLHRPYVRADVVLVGRHQSAPGAKLILCSDRYILDMPAPLFYADRPTMQAYVTHKPDQVEGLGTIDPVTNDPKFRDPKPLGELVTTADSLLLTESGLLPSIEANYVFHPIETDGRFTLGLIRSH
jgi:4-amino-4-deoxy-L-arabinose transferase-like glycosyltransferase